MKTKLLLVLMALVALPLGSAGAANFDRREIENASPYKDLPGVKVPRADPGNSFGGNCTSEVRFGHRYRDRYYNSFGQPVVVYVCEQNGVTIESLRPPSTNQWPMGKGPQGWPWGK